MKDHLGFGV